MRLVLQPQRLRDRRIRDFAVDEINPLGEPRIFRSCRLKSLVRDLHRVRQRDQCDGSVRQISTNVAIAPWSAAVTASNDDGPPLD